MPATTFPEYSQAVEDVLAAAVASTEAVLARIEIDARSSLRGHISGVLQFDDGSELHFREFVDTGLTEPRLAYAYHYQDVDKELIFRYDNATHRPVLPQPSHKHTLAGTQASLPPTLTHVIDEARVGPRP